MAISNSQALDFFHSLSCEGANPLSTKILPQNDMSPVDAEFITKYSVPGLSLLDLGTGTGLTINKLPDFYSKIVCVEPYAEFSKFISPRDNLLIINSVIGEIDFSETFDMITAFGLMQYFNEHEALSLYKNIYNFLNTSGMMIVKQQFGVEDDVEINDISPELNKKYFSQYRTVEKESGLLLKAGFKSCYVYDIYGGGSNRWSNTHFFSLICLKEDRCLLEKNNL